jgi:hypothetical protein
MMVRQTARCFHEAVPGQRVIPDAKTFDMVKAESKSEEKKRKKLSRPSGLKPFQAAGKTHVELPA